MNKTKFNDLKVAVPFAALLLGGVYFYMAQNLILAVAAGALAAFLFYMDRKNPADEKDVKSLYIFMLITCAVLAIARIYRVISFPYDFYSDEWTGIVDTYYKMKGENSFFSYFKRSGAALPYVPDLFYVLSPALFGNHIEYMRFIPLAVFAGTAVELYFLGKLIKDRNLGIALLFIYCVSGWALFNSRILIDYIYLPLFTVAFIHLFFLYMKGKSRGLLAGLSAVFLAGFFTHTAWIIMAPFAAYLLYEFRGDMGKPALKKAATALSAAAVFAALVFLGNSGPILWASGMTVAKEGNPLIESIKNIFHIPAFFMLPLKSSQWFSDKLAVLSWPELLLLAGGIAAGFSGLKDRLSRVFLAGFCLSLITLLISSDIGHHARHIMILPFTAIISGLFLDRFVKWRYSVFVTVMLPLFFVNTFFYMFNDWNNTLRTEPRNREMALFIDWICRDRESLFVYGTKPHGEYEAYLYSNLAYKKTTTGLIERVVFTVHPTLRRQVAALFPGAKAKYFFSREGRQPVVLFVVDINGDSKLREYFNGMSAGLETAAVKLWNLDYDGAISVCESNCGPVGNDGRAMLKNTFFRHTQLRIYEILQKGGLITGVLLNKEKPMILTADWALRLGEAYYSAGDLKNAMLYAKKAALLSPEWDEPKKAIMLLRAQGMK